MFMAQTLFKSQKGYQAFRAGDKELRRLKIRPTLRAWERMAYNHLLRIVEHEEGTEFALVYTFCVIIVKGSNLAPVIDSIDNHCCEYIQEYHSSLGDMPEKEDAPVINTIAIHVETREDMVKATDQALTDMAKSRSTQNH